ncbi:hypothetical protein Psta_3860 [Pirellula staleyi DSM 6068]|uniref:Uncharacterized protein n=1 Tax=Pirellula staleyi (strain ATCC 27377 / DSM 6068 / ICPB 4128) TaxID=530564 RepID=D2R130_PIRSD|nr:hypothetical protein [Pirellula staleyi]ADB18515.1 hypothetical protein Psta_3860 [Pirellula staleyi DSM 6068]
MESRKRRGTDAGPFGTLRLGWPMVVLCLIPIAVSLLVTIACAVLSPWDSDANPLLLLAGLMASTVVYLLVRSIRTGVLQLKHQTYLRDQQPIRFWLHIAGMSLVLAYLIAAMIYSIVKLSVSGN